MLQEVAKLSVFFSLILLTIHCGNPSQEDSQLSYVVDADNRLVDGFTGKAIITAEPHLRVYPFHPDDVEPPEEGGEQAQIDAIEQAKAAAGQAPEEDRDDKAQPGEDESQDDLAAQEGAGNDIFTGDEPPLHAEEQAIMPDEKPEPEHKDRWKLYYGWVYYVHEVRNGYARTRKGWSDIKWFQKIELVDEAYRGDAVVHMQPSAPVYKEPSYLDEVNQIKHTYVIEVLDVVNRFAKTKIGYIPIGFLWKGKTTEGSKPFRTYKVTHPSMMELCPRGSPKTRLFEKYGKDSTRKFGQAVLAIEYGSPAQTKAVTAFLSALAYAEGTLHCYNLALGNEPFYDYSRHPNGSTRFTDKLGRTRTSGAAGRYQYLIGTWNGIKNHPNVTAEDFGPAAQDRGALHLIKGKRKSLRIDGVLSRTAYEGQLRRINGTWASLPQSPHGQRTESYKTMWWAYQTYLGQLTD